MGAAPPDPVGNEVALMELLQQLCGKRQRQLGVIVVLIMA